MLVIVGVGIMFIGDVCSVGNELWFVIIGKCCRWISGRVCRLYCGVVVLFVIFLFYGWCGMGWIGMYFGV